MKLRRCLPRACQWALMGILAAACCAGAGAQNATAAQAKKAAQALAAAPGNAAAPSVDQLFGLPPLQPGSAAQGKLLFTGRAHLQNGGPACAECHTIAGLGFPGGGTLAPDLTGFYQRAGPLGMRFVLRTLYFPAMQPVYRKHQLTLEEQGDLLAFFATAPSKSAEKNPTGAIVGIAVIGCLCLFLLTGYLWRDRVRGIRRPMVERARAAARKARAAGMTQGGAGTPGGGGEHA